MATKKKKEFTGDLAEPLEPIIAKPLYIGGLVFDRSEEAALNRPGN
jgi:hypothetical protein